MRWVMFAMFPVVPLLAWFSALSQGSAQWYAGAWDSSIYNRGERTRTVGLRIEVVDAETRIHVKGAQVLLKGKYVEERAGSRGDSSGFYEPQEREFELGAETPADGVVVFALNWQKEYPWRTYFGDSPPREPADKSGSWRFLDSWIKAVDDVEKVQTIEIRHPRYRYEEIPFTLEHFLDVGQDKSGDRQDVRLFDKFEEAWKKEIKRRDVKFCVLDLGKKFPDFENKQCTRPEFFQKIREKDFGTVYQEPFNLFTVGEYPQSECGPYFVYQIEVPLERRSGQIDVDVSSSREPEDETTVRPDVEEKRGEEETQKADVEKETAEERRRAAERERRGAEARREKERAEQETREQAIEESRNNLMGIAVETLSVEKRKELGLYRGVKGVLITYVDPSSPSHLGELRPGMVIDSIDHRAVTSEADSPSGAARRKQAISSSLVSGEELAVLSGSPTVRSFSCTTFRLADARLRGSVILVSRMGSSAFFLRPATVLLFQPGAQRITCAEAPTL